METFATFSASEISRDTQARFPLEEDTNPKTFWKLTQNIILLGGDFSTTRAWHLRLRWTQQTSSVSSKPTDSKTALCSMFACAQDTGSEASSRSMGTSEGLQFLPSPVTFSYGENWTDSCPD